jgi:hypothetical protein
VFATRRLVMGDTIMVEDAVMVGDTGNLWQLAERDAWFTREFDKLDPQIQVRRADAVLKIGWVAVGWVAQVRFCYIFPPK